jgi:hypothetical protein
MSDVSITDLIAEVISKHRFYAADDGGMGDNCDCGQNVTQDGYLDNEPLAIAAEHDKHVALLVADALESVTVPTEGVSDLAINSQTMLNSGATFSRTDIQRLVAALASFRIPVTAPTKPRKFTPEQRADLIDAATSRIQDTWNDVGATTADVLAANVVAAQEFIWLSMHFPVTAPTELEYGLIGHVDDMTPVFETRKFAENELANQIARLQREADPDPPPVMFQRVKRGPWEEVSS